MILDLKKTMVAFRCPACSGVTKSMVGIFSVSGTLFKLRCPECPDSYMTIEKTEDSKVRLCVPCIVCGKNHYHTISQKVFFDSDLFVIPCALSGIDICFIGKEKEVESAINISNQAILQALGDYSIDDIKSKEKDDCFMTDPQVLDIVKYVIADINDDGEIHCNCPSGEGDYECEILEGSVLVKCKNCHASLEIDASSVDKAHQFLHVKSLHLK